MPRRLQNKKLLDMLANLVLSHVNILIDELMYRFDNEIIPYEDTEDPARPSVFRDAFRQFLGANIDVNVVNANTVEIIIDDEALGMDEDLDPWTRDGLRIIGTILNGIPGRYILVTSRMTGQSEGRFGRAFIMREEQYRREAPSKGWDLNKPLWKFSDFPGIPDFFSVSLDKLLDKIIKSMGAR